MNLFEKLTLARQISFTDGAIKLLNQRVVIFNASLFAEYISRINNDQAQINNLYDAVKVSFKEEFAKSLGKEFGFSFKDFVKWMTDLAGLTGWGIFSWQDLDDEKKRGIITVDNSPIAVQLKGRVNTPVDHIIRGFIAGGASAAFKEDMDVVEQECVALGAQKCKFLLKVSKDF